MEYQPLRYENLNILVVEDDDSSFLLIEELLSAYKLNIIRAVNAQSAMDYIHSGICFNLALLDIKLPGQTNGIELAKAIHKKLPNLGIIIQSAAYLLPNQKRDLQSFPCDFISKPLDLSNFFLLIYKHLEHSLNISA